MHDYMLHEMAKIRIEEFREDATRARVAKVFPGLTGWSLGWLGGLSRLVAGGGVVHGATKEVCCA